ncbi:MAG: hypothetical protein EXR62_13810 [Chloroflexi bacterium]|nr:hypothetical protein [Chloroflexota bacterium]
MSAAPDEATRLAALFDDLEGKQLDFLDQAAKRVIELTTGLQAVFLAVAALGNKFPPANLKDSFFAQALFVAVLIFYWAAILAAAWAVQPRPYKRYPYNVTAMRAEFNQMVAHKAAWVNVAGSLFVIASLALVALIIAIVWGGSLLGLLVIPAVLAVAALVAVVVWGATRRQ